MEHKTNEDISFRDRLTTVSDDGDRVCVYAKKPKGKFYNYRKLLAFFLLAFLFIAPFIKVHGEQFMLFNIIERKFIIFGVVFWPQDFHLFVLALITMIVFVVLFTVIYGRLFCGWVCPPACASAGVPDPPPVTATRSHRHSCPADPARKYAPH